MAVPSCPMCTRGPGQVSRRGLVRRPRGSDVAGIVSSTATTSYSHSLGGSVPRSLLAAEANGDLRAWDRSSRGTPRGRRARLPAAPASSRSPGSTEPPRGGSGSCRRRRARCLPEPVSPNVRLTPMTPAPAGAWSDANRQALGVSSRAVASVLPGHGPSPPHDPPTLEGSLAPPVGSARRCARAWFASRSSAARRHHSSKTAFMNACAAILTATFLPGRRCPRFLTSCRTEAPWNSGYSIDARRRRAGRCRARIGLGPAVPDLCQTLRRGTQATRRAIAHAARDRWRQVWWESPNRRRVAGSSRWAAASIWLAPALGRFDHSVGGD